MIHEGLEGAINMGERSGTAAKTHRPAEVIAATLAEAAFPAHNTSLDSDALTDSKVSDACTDSGHSTSGFMTKDQWLANGKITVTTMFIIMDYVDV